MKRFFALYFALRGYTLAALFLLLLWMRLHTRTPLRPEFLFLVLAGMALRLWAGAHLGPHGNGSRAEAPKLCRGGPYRFSRNPLYLSNLMVGVGLVLFGNALPLCPTLVFVAALLAHHAILAHWEEARLRILWGETYAAYARSAPRWLGLRSGGAASEAPASARRTLAWQGRNLAYTVLCVLLVWGAASWG